MPEQLFLDTADEVAAIVSWDFGYQSIALSYKGDRVASFTDIEPLTAGTSGPTPDGNTVAVRMTKVDGIDQFQVALNGSLLNARQPNYAAGGPSSQMNLDANGMVKRPTFSLSAGGGLMVDGRKVQKQLEKATRPSRFRRR